MESSDIPIHIRVWRIPQFDSVACIYQSQQPPIQSYDLLDWLMIKLPVDRYLLSLSQKIYRHTRMIGREIEPSNGLGESVRLVNRRATSKSRRWYIYTFSVRFFFLSPRDTRISILACICALRKIADLENCRACGCFGNSFFSFFFPPRTDRRALRA